MLGFLGKPRCRLKARGMKGGGGDSGHFRVSEEVGVNSTPSFELKSRKFHMHALSHSCRDTRS